MLMLPMAKSGAEPLGSMVGGARAGPLRGPLGASLALGVGPAWGLKALWGVHLGGWVGVGLPLGMGPAWVWAYHWVWAFHGPSPPGAHALVQASNRPAGREGSAAPGFNQSIHHPVIVLPTHPSSPPPCPRPPASHQGRFHGSWLQSKAPVPIFNRAPHPPARPSSADWTTTLSGAHALVQAYRPAATGVQVQWLLAPTKSITHL
jgi:hypothetical protein